MFFILHRFFIRESRFHVPKLPKLIYCLMDQVFLMNMFTFWTLSSSCAILCILYRFMVCSCKQLFSYCTHLLFDRKVYHPEHVFHSGHGFNPAHVFFIGDSRFQAPTLPERNLDQDHNAPGALHSIH